VSKKVLGRGLRALIPTADDLAPAAATRTEQPREVSIHILRRNPFQPRRIFEDAALEELAQSVRVHGILQPILVRPKGPFFEIVAGERRWLAAQRVGLTVVPVQIRDVPDASLLETALVENIQRQDLNPIEESEAFKRLIDEVGLTHAEVALRVGRDRATISNSIRLLALPQIVRDLVEEGKLSAGHARTLLSLKRPEEMVMMAQEGVGRGLSVRQLEAHVRKALEAPAAASKPGALRLTENAQQRDSLPPEIRAVREALTSKLSTRIRIDRRDNGHGSIVIEFYSDSDLDRLSTLILAGYVHM